MSIARSPRFAVTMWDYSWLLRRDGDEAEYADVDRVLDELVERGYDCVRIDAFPHVVGTGQAEDVVVAAMGSNWMWGNHQPVRVAPLPALVEFVGGCADRGVGVGLSSWWPTVIEGTTLPTGTTAELTAAWTGTLDVLDREGLLGAVRWVDLSNEFPTSPPDGFFDMFPGGEFPGAAVTPWDSDTLARVNRWIHEPIRELRDRHPALSYTASLLAVHYDNVHRLDLSACDLFEVHIWMVDFPEFAERSRHSAGSDPALHDGMVIHAQTATKLWADERDRWVGWMRDHIAGSALWADRFGLPLVTTEGWGSIGYNDVPGVDNDNGWAWLKDACAASVEMAVKAGWTGVCTSNFSEPHFPSLWGDVGWHRRLTDLIRGDRQSA